MEKRKRKHHVFLIRKHIFISMLENRSCLYNCLYKKKKKKKEGGDKPRWNNCAGSLTLIVNDIFLSQIRWGGREYNNQSYDPKGANLRIIADGQKGMENIYWQKRCGEIGRGRTPSLVVRSRRGGESYCFLLSWNFLRQIVKYPTVQLRTR